jgi:hypothetical protein
MFCIPKEFSKKLLQAAKAGEFNIQQLTELNSKERTELFSKYLDKGTAKGVNTLFEKALVSEQKSALKNWAETVFGTKAKETPKYKNIMRTINNLDETGVLNPKEADSFLSDLVAEQLGVTVSPEEAKNISEKANNLEKISQKGSDNEFGLPSLEYFKARKEMFDYLNSLAPTSKLKILSSTVARGNMLFSIKSPMTNIIGNSVQAIQQVFERRLSSGQFKGTNSDFAKSYFKFANKVFKETGYDVTRMIHLDDTQKTLGEQNIQSEGKGTVRKIGRFYEDFVFKKLMAAPDVAFSAAHFADSANLASTKMAKEFGLKGEEAKNKALEIFKDSTSLNPLTEEGQYVRAQALADASYATYQNDSYYSTLALAVRKILNTATGDTRLGDQLMPFVKTPANVIGATIDASGVSAIRGAFNLKGALESAKMGNREPLKKVVRDFVRSGLGLSLAFIISSMFDPDDFIGEYPTSAKERELLTLKNAQPNSIKIGNKWVSLDYFGAIAAPLVGIMYARKYGDGLVNTAYKYWQGVGTQLLKFPSYKAVKDLYDSFGENIQKATDVDKNIETKTKDTIKEAGVSAVDFLSSRVIPAIVYDTSKAFDKYERKYDTKSASEKLQSKLPILRESLPIKTDTLGNKIETESALSTFLFGSRVKTAKENTVITELNRLSSTGNLPSITDVEKTSDRVKLYKEQMQKAGTPEKYEKNIQKFKDDFSKKLNTLTTSFTYKRVNDEKKAQLIENAKNDLLDTTLLRGGYKKPLKINKK